MAAVLVPGFEHLPGVSCGSTSVRDLLAARGTRLSEAMCFGLGAGLGFYFWSSAQGLSWTFIGRSATLEPELCENLGLAWEEHREPDPDRAWEQVKAAVDAGRAVILSTDLKDLPHCRARSSFNGHRVVLAGYDLTREVALLADTDRPGLVEVPFDALRRARASEGPPVGAMENAYWEIRGQPTRPLPEAVARGVRRAGERMLEDPSGFGGLAAMEAFADDLPHWPALRDFAQCAREGYNAVERRGTGGGFFRSLYAEFLDQAHELRPELGLKALAHACRELSWGWSELATAMHLAAEDGAWDGLPEHARALCKRERALAERLAAITP